MIFLIEYDRRAGRLVTLTEFRDEDLRKAEDIRLAREVALNEARSEHEVVLLEAHDKEALERTHRRYFATLDELLSDFEIFDIQAIDDRLERRHPAEHLERHAHGLVRFGDDHGLLHNVAGRFGRARERAAQHHRVAAEQQRLHERAVALHAAVRDER